MQEQQERVGIMRLGSRICQEAECVRTGVRGVALPGKWRSRFVAKRLGGLLDGPRPRAPRTVTDAVVERVVTLTLETAPRDVRHWSTRAMARQCGLSQSTVSRIWHVSAAVVAEQDKHEQQAKSQGGTEEEVDRDDGSGVSRQDGVPSRRRP